MSDAHELAARLRDLVGALDWDAPKHITQDIDARVTAAAAELVRLADVEAERDRLRAALVRWRFSPDIEMNGSPLAKALIRETDALLASAGPPQEAPNTGDLVADLYTMQGVVQGDTDPPPERRCTCPRGGGYSDARLNTDPACPEHGTSAGPPQVPASGDWSDAYPSYDGMNDPPPERRCTCPRVMFKGREIAQPHEPACPKYPR